MPEAMKARMRAENAEFDRIAASKACLRCEATGAAVRVVSKASTPAGIACQEIWPCGDCGSGVSRYLVEVLVAGQVGGGPKFEAEMAKLGRVSAEQLAYFGVGTGEARKAGPTPPAATPRPKAPRKRREKSRANGSPASPEAAGIRPLELNRGLISTVLK